MNISDGISIVDIDSKRQLIDYFDSIAQLFYESFGKELDRELWEWAYINNPFGQPIVSVAIYENKVVGHYAVVPMNLENDTEKLIAFLSMTTMVAVDFRRHKLFQILAERVYDQIDNLNVPAMVFGFPNDNSAPGFIKRLGWEISEDYKVVTFQAGMIDNAVSQLQQNMGKNYFTLNLAREDIRAWRTNKPNQSWLYQNGLGLKAMGKESDVMHLSSPESLLLAKTVGSINMILPVTQEFLVEAGCDVNFPYRFGYRTFNMVSKPKIFVQMSMSDIF